MDFKKIKTGQTLPEREFTATNVSLFCYNAAIWNPHRIHYDEKYTTEIEKHPRIVIDGPLQGDWLSQIAINWIGDNATLIKFNYSNRRASYLGETLKAGGKVVDVDYKANIVELELFLKNENGEITSPGSATLQF
jgi:3-methylfumaryl-CoA hydratase